MPRFLRQLIELWTQLGLNQKISLTLATLAVVGVMAAVLAWSSRPDLQPINIGGALDPKDAGEIAAALDEKGVKYEISGGGTTILVPRDQVYKLRMELASKGAFSGGTVGFEIFDKGNFGISDFVQRTNSLRAIQGELARTIGQLDGVRSARVMVVMPENRLLVTDTNRRSTASVLVETGGKRLPTEAVNSIRSLVAYAVEGLKVDDVVVVDNRGNVLSEELREEGVGLGLTAGQIRYRTGLEEYYSGKVESMLATVLGPGRAVVRVSVDVDNTTSTTVEERFDPDTQILRNTTTTEDSNISSEARPAGIVGSAANTPDGAAAPAGNGNPVSNSQQTRKSKTETYEIGRSTINTVKNAGEIRRVSAAVFVALRTSGTGDARTPQPRTPEEITALRTMVVNALGVVPGRAPGAAADQVVSIQEVDFATDPLTAVADTAPLIDAQREQWIEYGERGLVVLAAIVGFLIFIRVLRRSHAEAATLEVYNGPAGGRGGELDGEITPELLNQLIRQKPDNVGLTLKRWMSAEQK